LLAVALGTVAASAASAASPPDGPELSLMALGARDFARARVAKEGQVDPEGAVAAYARDFAPGSRAGRTPLIVAGNHVALLRAESEARAQLATLRLAISSPRGRADFGRSFAKSFSRGSGLRVRSVAVSRVTSLGIGVDSLRWGVTMQTRAGRLHVAFVLVRVDRALGTIVLVGRPGRIVALADVKRLGTAQRNRFRTGFTITRGAPAVTGAATQGSTLTAEHLGRWNGGPSEFAYQWSRCDAAAACTPIPGAAGQTYVVAPADAGAFLKVTVTARNTVSTLAVDSPPTAQVG
jgi:hypothetical protein